jgi:hypothetical protein
VAPWPQWLTAPSLRVPAGTTVDCVRRRFSRLSRVPVDPISRVGSPKDSPRMHGEVYTRYIVIGAVHSTIDVAGQVNYMTYDSGAEKMRCYYSMLFGGTLW